jgi:hypothetical protein
MTDVRQERPTWVEPFDDFKRLRHRVVRRMRPMPQRIQNENVEIVQQCKRFLRNAIAIREVRKRSKTEAEDRPSPMKDWHWADVQRPHVKGAIDRMQLDLRGAAALFVRRIENVIERPPKIGCGLRIRIGRYRAALHHVEAPHFVETHDVIGVAVREEDGVHTRHAVCQRLLTQIGCGINQNSGSACRGKINGWA